VTYIANITRSEGDPKILSSGPSSLSSADRLGRALGWFSVALGFMELVAPQRITRALGMDGSEGLVRAYGARELGSGILSMSPEKQIGLWSRVSGDGLDIATLVTALRPNNPKRGNVGLALGLVLGVTLLDILAGQLVTARHSRKPGNWHQYSNRSGFPQGVERARGAARKMEPSPI
jgi:hypothetical protein